MEAEEREQWRQFCTQYAKSVAFNFAESWRRTSLKSERRVSASEVIEHFTRALSQELSERLHESDTHQTPSLQFASLLQPSSSVPLLTSAVNLRAGGSTWRSLNDSRRPASVTDMGIMVRSHSEMSSVQRSSVTQLDRQPSAPQATTRAQSSASKRLSWFRSHFPTKTAVELIKEGSARYMSGLELETKQWRKCRLCLVKTAGGYLLEFYSPPKSSRAKSGIFCFLIMEIRETTPLEFEDSAESIFVIRAFNGVEYVVEARNHEDCQQWINVIRESIPMINLNVPSRSFRQPSAPPIGANITRSRRFLSTRSLNNVHAMASSQSTDTRIPVTMRAFPPGLEIYPWFHARLSRTVSARLVLHNGEDGHGLFLVRQSETRPGEFVLTFNCQGKAKHVRILVMADGECRIHQMIFDTMVDLLEHFRDNPIPLENSSHPPMFLSEYVICWRRRSIALSEVDVRDFLTYAGSLRLDIRALEQLVLRQRSNRRHRTSSAHTEANTYNFI